MKKNTTGRSTPARLLGATILGLIASALHGQTYSSVGKAPGVGNHGDGASAATVDLDNNGRPEILLMAYDDPSGNNAFRYRVGWNPSDKGVPSSWSPNIDVNGLGHFGTGAGMAVGHLDSDPRPDLLMMAYDPGTGSGATFRWIVGRNLSGSGQAQTWTSPQQIAGNSAAAAGAGVALAQIDDDPRPDMVLRIHTASKSKYDVYRVAFNLDANGKPQKLSVWYSLGVMGFAANGGDVVLAQLDTNPRPDMLIFGVDPTSYLEGYRYRIGWNLDSNGKAAYMSTIKHLRLPFGPGAAGSAEGAGVTAADFDRDGRQDLLFMHYQTRSGGNEFHYGVLNGVGSRLPSATTAFSHGSMCGARLWATVNRSVPTNDTVLFDFLGNGNGNTHFAFGHLALGLTSQDVALPTSGCRLLVKPLVFVPVSNHGSVEVVIPPKVRGRVLVQFVALFGRTGNSSWYTSNRIDLTLQ
jgi:hypothetical protein